MPPTPPPSVSTPALPSSSSAGIILDSDQIPEGVSKSFVRLPGEEQSEFHARVTHLHHQRQNIRQIGDLASVRNLTVLYLYENRLTKIERLDPVPNLQLLYLQRNSIGALENLGHLVKLRKLYLSGNRISIVEGLDKLVSLRGRTSDLLASEVFVYYYNIVLLLYRVPQNCTWTTRGCPRAKAWCLTPAAAGSCNSCRC